MLADYVGGVHVIRGQKDKKVPWISVHAYDTRRPAPWTAQICSTPKATQSSVGRQHNPWLYRTSLLGSNWLHLVEHWLPDLKVKKLQRTTLAVGELIAVYEGQGAVI